MPHLAGALPQFCVTKIDVVTHRPLACQLRVCCAAQELRLSSQHHNKKQKDVQVPQESENVALRTNVGGVQVTATAAFIHCLHEQDGRELYSIRL